MLKIVSAPNPVLSSIAKPITKVDSSVTKIIEEMKKTLATTTDPKGVGLAAPQVGKSLRIFLAKPTDSSKVSVFINPKIEVRGGARGEAAGSADCKGALTEGNRATGPRKKGSKKLEGCLSLPNIWGPVLRASSLTLSYLDEQGNKHTKSFTGFMAAIIQHEVDHLDGILFPKRVLEQKGILYKSHKNTKGEDEFEEVDL